MKAEISKAIKAEKLGFIVSIFELLAQRKFVSPECHAHKRPER